MTVLRSIGHAWNMAMALSAEAAMHEDSCSTAEQHFEAVVGLFKDEVEALRAAKEAADIRRNVLGEQAQDSE